MFLALNINLKSCADTIILSYIDMHMNILRLMHIQRAGCDEFVMAATGCCCHDNERHLGVSLSFSLPPPFLQLSGLEPVIISLFTCDSLSNLFRFNPFGNLCCRISCMSSIYLCGLTVR